MELGLVEALVMGAFTLAGGFLGKGIDWLKARSQTKNDDKKADSDVKTTEVEKAAVIYREMIADLRQDIDEMFVLLKTLEQERLECRVENATLKGEVKALMARVETLEKELKGDAPAA